jgi:hypothetical protein
MPGTTSREDKELQAAQQFQNAVPAFSWRESGSLGEGQPECYRHDFRQEILRAPSVDRSRKKSPRGYRVACEKIHVVAALTRIPFQKFLC